MSDENQPFENTQPKNPYLIPGAIVVAGFLIATALFASKSADNTGAAATGRTLNPVVLPVTDADHVFGDANPDVYFIEYSDYQCPYCERFHGTVEEIVKQYDGKVAWVYRHFPLDSIHPQARPAAIASECAADLGGNDAFWGFTTKIFEDQRSMSTSRYQEIARELGLDEAAFTECLTSGKFDDRIGRDLQNVLDIGGQGTPYNVLLTKNGDTVSFAGALPLDRVQVLVKRALDSLN